MAQATLPAPLLPQSDCLETNLNGLFSLRLSGERNLFGLAPGGVYLAAPIARGTGELLPRLFTLTLAGARAISRGGMFSVALSLPL